MAGFTNVFEHPNGRYAAMSFSDPETGERAFLYDIYLDEPVHIDAARSLAMAEFPADTTELWYQEYPLCALIGVQSSTLAARLGDPRIGGGTGMAQVVIYNAPGGDVNPDGDLPLQRTKIDAIGILMLADPEPPPGDGNC